VVPDVQWPPSCRTLLVLRPDRAGRSTPGRGTGVFAVLAGRTPGAATVQPVRPCPQGHQEHRGGASLLHLPPRNPAP
jgi:hypothetical protein